MRTRTFLALSSGAAALTAIFIGTPLISADAAGDAPQAAAATPATPAARPAQGQTPTPSPGTATAATTRAAAPTAAADAAFVKQYCATCHSDRVKSGQLSLEGLDVTNIGSHAETWEKVVKKLRTGMMPPSGAPRPNRVTLDTFTLSLEARLDRARTGNEHLAAPALHRMNRTEYQNAVRDLLAFDADVTTLLPGDGSNHGFDNLADGLSISPTLIQAYVSAAMKISRQAVGDRTLQQGTVTYPAPANLAQDTHIDGLPLGTRGGMVVRHYFPLDAEYEIGTGGGGRGGGGGAGGADITIDGVVPVPAGAGGAGGGGGRGGARFKVSAGPRVIAAAVPDRTRPGGADDIYSDFRVDGAFAVGGGVNNIVITGPFNATGPGDTPSRRLIFTCKPASAAEETPCARKILSSLARRAYRGPVTAAEVETLMDFYQSGRKEGDFENGVQQGIARILVAPRFLYRVEAEPAGLASGATYHISDLELASRLSFFLWSSIPDEELLRTAEQGRLRTPAVLKQQVARMLADPKSKALVDNFAGQWLYLRELEALQTEARHFNDNLRQAMQRETELLFETIVKEDRSVLDLLDSNYTFVDQKLAKHYGIPGIKGSYFRRVTLPPDSPRRGLLGHGSMLTVTSVATRTSPVMRGKWILENLFGAPPPEPPPGVETNLEEPTPEKPTTLRQRLELHRRNPTCASCHRIMDPIGFSLENFDLVGAWRDREGTAPIDSTGELADGTPVNGPQALRVALLTRSDAFVMAMAEKMLMYATGRPMHTADMPDIRAIARRTAANGYRFSTLLAGVIESDQFQKRVKGAVRPE